MEFKKSKAESKTSYFCTGIKEPMLWWLLPQIWAAVWSSGVSQPVSDCFSCRRNQWKAERRKAEIWYWEKNT